MISINEILKTAGQKEDNVVAIYPYGSRVYGTFSPLSDYDFIIVVNKLLSNGNEIQSDQYSANNINVSLYSKLHFQHLIDSHTISALETQFLPSNIVILEAHKFKFTYNESSLRNSISMKADRSWVKAKKKFTVVNDYNPYTAKKSLFHSLRILTFGLQLALTHTIVDYSAANEFWAKIKDDESVDWAHYKELYQETYNGLKSQLRLIAKK